MIDVERLDFVTVPTRNAAAAREFYTHILGLPLDSNNDAEIATTNVTFVFWNPETDGLEFKPNEAGIGLRVPDVRVARERSNPKVSTSSARRSTPVSASWPSCATSTETS